VGREKRKSGKGKIGKHGAGKSGKSGKGKIGKHGDEKPWPPKRFVLV
jgi:hypothetical protein